MIVVVIQFDVLAQKRTEFVQTITRMIVPTRSERGCLAHHLSQDIKEENRFFIVQRWQDQADLDRYWRSDLFGAFLGSFHLLDKPPDIKIHAVSFTAGMEAVKAARENAQTVNSMP
jgi:quinol monooxygenase YgiN